MLVAVRAFAYTDPADNSLRSKVREGVPHSGVMRFMGAIRGQQGPRHYVARGPLVRQARRPVIYKPPCARVRERAGNLTLPGVLAWPGRTLAWPRPKGQSRRPTSTEPYGCG